jgi:DNA-binding NarL/FixJ family response regulator
MVHVALLDDHPAVLAGLRRLIGSEPDLAVVGAAAAAPELARQLGDAHPDVLVLDYDLSRGNGLAHCRRIKNRTSAPAVVVYSGYAGPALSLAASAANADAMIDKADPVQALLRAIRVVAYGEVMLPAVPHNVYETAVARVATEDRPVLAMLLSREPLEAIADALRTDRNEIAWRAQRIVARLCPTLWARVDEPAERRTT